MKWQRPKSDKFKVWVVATPVTEFDSVTNKPFRVRSSDSAASGSKARQAISGQRLMPSQASRP